MKTVEIIGIPGSGKSTLCDLMVTTYPQHYISLPQFTKLALPYWLQSLDKLAPHRNDKILRLIFKYFWIFRLKHNANLKSLIDRLPISRSFSIRHMVKDQMDTILAVYEVLERRHDLSTKTLLLDEGLLHRCISLFIEDHQPSHLYLKRYIEQSSLCDVLVKLDISAMDAEIRCQKRDYPKRIQGLNESEREIYFNRCKDIIDYCFEQASIGQKITIPASSEMPDGIALYLHQSLQ